jgi:hypothetical protein
VIAGGATTRVPDVLRFETDRSWPPGRVPPALPERAGCQRPRSRPQQSAEDQRSRRVRSPPAAGPIDRNARVTPHRRSSIAPSAGKLERVVHFIHPMPTRDRYARWAVEPTWPTSAGGFTCWRRSPISSSEVDGLVA